MSTSTDEYPGTTLEMLFDGIKTSIECSPVKFVVFESKTGPMRTLTSKHKPFVNLDHCEVVCSLHTSVDPFQLFIESVVTKFWPLRPLLLRNPLLVTLEQWFCKVVCHDDNLLDFECTDQTKHALRRKCITGCMPQQYEP